MGVAPSLCVQPAGYPTPTYLPTYLPGWAEEAQRVRMIVVPEAVCDYICTVGLSDYLHTYIL